MESGSMGQGGSRRSWKGGGRSGQRAEMHWGPLKSAEKPHPWAVDHEPMGPGAMGPVGGGVHGGWGWGGWGRGWGLGVGVEPWGQEPWVHDKRGRRGRVRAGWGGLGGEGPFLGPALAAMQVEG